MMIEKLKKYGQDFVASKLESLTGEARAKLEKQRERLAKIEESIAQFSA